MVSFMSRSALMSLTRLQIEALEKYTRILAPEIPIIETVGGGSARCMIAAIHCVSMRNHIIICIDATWHVSKEQR